MINKNVFKAILIFILGVLGLAVATLTLTFLFLLSPTIVSILVASGFIVGIIFLIYDWLTQHENNY